MTRSPDLDRIFHHIGSVQKNGCEALFVSLSQANGRGFIEVRRGFRHNGPDAARYSSGITLRLERLDDLVALIMEAKATADRLGILDNENGGSDAGE